MKPEVGTYPSEGNARVQMKILLVDSSTTQATKTRHTLEEAGYEVAWTKTGEEALRIAPEVRPGLLISDITLSDMPGFLLCQRFKKATGMYNIPVLLTTSLTDPSNVLRGLASGVDDLLIKPAADEEILTRVDFIARNRHLFSPQSPSSQTIEFMGHHEEVEASAPQLLCILLSGYEAAARQQEPLQKKLLAMTLRNKQLEAENEDLKARDLAVTRQLDEQPADTQKRIQQLMKFLETVTHERDQFVQELHASRELAATLRLQLQNENIKITEQSHEITSQQTVIEKLTKANKELTARLETGQSVVPAQPTPDADLVQLRESLQLSQAEATRATYRLAAIEWKLVVREDRILELENQVIQLSGLLPTDETRPEGQT